LDSKADMPAAAVALQASAAADRRPPALAVTSELPWPLDTGGHLRSYHLLRAIASAYNLTLIAPAEGPEQAIAAREAGLATAGVAVRAPRTRRTSIGEAWKIVLQAMQRQPYVLYGRHYRPAVARLLRETMAASPPAFLYFDHLDSFSYAPVSPRPPIVLDLHNIYSLIAARTAIETAGARRLYLEREARLLARAERKAVREADIVFAVSPQECEYYRKLGGTQVHLIPNGVDTSRFAHLPAGREQSWTILYLGALSWGPNAAAALFLAREVLPALRQRWPQARLQIVGKAPSAEIVALPHQIEGVAVAASVPDVLPYLREAALMAVPLDVGGGTRLKILEALAAGLPVVSSAIGAEGLSLVAGEHLMIAERPQMVDAIVSLLQDRLKARAIASAGRTAVQRQYDWSAIGETATSAIRKGTG
jgi:glycosyltransferase involved in cell wall biosynthesis